MHAELTRTVDDLSKWLSVVEAGLVGLLDRTNDEDVIEEEDFIAGSPASLDSSADAPPDAVPGGLRTLAMATKT